LPDWQHAETLPDWRVANISVDGVAPQVLADGDDSSILMRGMALGPVNPPKVNSMRGLGPIPDDEFVVTHLSSIRHRDAKDNTSDGR
jgi:hypothetical protein